MADVDFFFDPVCPWAWIASRWVNEVKTLRDLEVDWRFISLRMINGHRDYETEFPAGYVESHSLGLRLLRVAASIRELDGNSGVARFYTVVGERIHTVGNGGALGSTSGIAAALSESGLPTELASSAEDEGYDTVIRDETNLALSRAGAEVGTPIITFAPPDGPSFFGPVISRIPRGEEAISLWESIERLGLFPGFAELKRAVRETPTFT